VVGFYVRTQKDPCIKTDNGKPSYHKVHRQKKGKQNLLFMNMGEEQVNTDKGWGDGKTGSE